MATSRVGRLLSCIRTLHVTLTSGLPINHELNLANLNLPHRASSSVQQPAHNQNPYYSIAKDTAHVNVSGRTHSPEFENPNTLLRPYSVHPVLTLVTCDVLPISSLRQRSRATQWADSKRRANEVPHCN